jgi:hypothetical protein
MIRISNLIYNSQWENTTKEELTKHLQYMLDEYNEATGKNIK